MSHETSKPEVLSLCCQEPMEVGFLIDAAHGGNNQQARWVAGERKAGWFAEVAMKQAATAEEVVTYRCPACGRLESFVERADAE